jgi:NitT/TauT family transport system ATP-binding protein
VTDAPVLEVRGVGKIYGTGTNSVVALKNITFSAARGEFLAIVGPSGCGKSTLLKVIGDLLAPSEGYVSVNGVPARQAREDGRFSYVFQNPVLLPWRRVEDNVRLPLEILRRSPRDPMELLEAVGLGRFASYYPAQLSGGMQQRVALARALTFDPDLLMMDEPFGAVDELTRDALNLELLKVWSQIKVTILLVTHSLVEAVFLADRILVLSSVSRSIRRIFEVGFSRPRDPSLRDKADFRDLVKCVREELG